MLSKLTNEQEQIIQTVRAFVDREVIPVATEMEHRDEYPHTLVDRMKELGIFGANIPESARRLILGENLKRLLRPILHQKGIRL